MRWAQLNFYSRAVQTEPGSNMLSRSNIPSDEWTLNPQTVQEIWGIFGRPEVDLFASEDNTHCQTYFSKDRDALAHDWPYLLLYAFPPITLIPQVIRRIREQKHSVLLVAPLSAHCSHMTHSPEMRPPLSSEWNDFAPPARTMGATSMGAFGPFRECAKYYFSG